MLKQNFPVFPDLVFSTKVETLPDLKGDINEVLDKSCPVNPVSGLRDNLLERLDSSDITDSERKTILENMSKISASQRMDVSDDVLIDMLPSRYASTQVDMQGVRDFYNRLILDEAKKSIDKGSVSEPDVNK